MPSKPVKKDGTSVTKTLETDVVTNVTQNLGGTDQNIFMVGDNFNVHIRLEYPEDLADVHAAHTVRLICVQLAPSLGAGTAYSTVYAGTLVENTDWVELDFPFAALDPGAGPGIYFIVATFDFGTASEHYGWKVGNLFFVWGT